MKLLNSLLEKYQASKKKTTDLNNFKISLMQAVSDGKLTTEELNLLTLQKETAGITDDDLKDIKIAAYLSAFTVAKQDKKITESEQNELLEIKKYLNINNAEIQSSEKELARFRLLAEINQGNLPQSTVANLVTQKDERIYWTEPSVLIEEKVLHRRYEGGSQGFSFRIMKGVSYRVGASRGYFVNETGRVPVSNGEFIITSKRVIFRGDGKTFSFKLDKILDIQLFTNGIYLSEANKSKPRMIKFAQEGNYDVVGAIIAYAINNYK